MSPKQEKAPTHFPIHLVIAPMALGVLQLRLVFQETKVRLSGGAPGGGGS